MQAVDFVLIMAWDTIIKINTSIRLRIKKVIVYLCNGSLRNIEAINVQTDVSLNFLEQLLCKVNNECLFHHFVICVYVGNICLYCLFMREANRHWNG
jgi:hypothetical protein